MENRLLSIEKIRAEIDHSIAATAKMREEAERTRLLMLEEQARIKAEAKKLNSESRYYPFIVYSGVGAAFATAVTAIIRILDHLLK